MNAIIFASNLSWGTTNDALRNGANVLTTKDRIQELAKSWYKNSVINNSDIQEFIKTAVAYPDTT